MGDVRGVEPIVVLPDSSPDPTVVERLLVGCLLVWQFGRAAPIELDFQLVGIYPDVWYW